MQLPENGPGDGAQNDQPRAARGNPGTHRGKYQKRHLDGAFVDSEIRRVSKRLADMRTGFANIDELERAGRYVGRRRATLGARFQKEWRRLERLQQYALPFEVKTNE